MWFRGKSPLLAPKTREKWGTRGCSFLEMGAGRGNEDGMKNRGMDIKHPKLPGGVGGVAVYVAGD
jgi:hypothetical protein